jgi:hypothetical protein
VKEKRNTHVQRQNNAICIIHVKANLPLCLINENLSGSGDIAPPFLSLSPNEGLYHSYSKENLSECNHTDHYIRKMHIRIKNKIKIEITRAVITPHGWTIRIRFLDGADSLWTCNISHPTRDGGKSIKTTDDLLPR